MTGPATPQHSDLKLELHIGYFNLDLVNKRVTASYLLGVETATPLHSDLKLELHISCFNLDPI